MRAAFLFRIARTQLRINIIRVVTVHDTARMNRVYAHQLRSPNTWEERPNENKDVEGRKIKKKDIGGH